jgi:hypothetical protein
MSRFGLVAIIACAVVALISAAPAGASGPAAPGKSIVQVNCGSAGTFWVAVPKSDQNNGVGQIVGMKGHGIGVSFTFTAIDATTGQTVFSDTSAVGKGHAHPNQTTTTCTFQPFPDTIASEFFGDQLPPGVAPTDIIHGEASGQIILKL